MTKKTFDAEKLIDMEINGEVSETFTDLYSDSELGILLSRLYEEEGKLLSALAKFEREEKNGIN